MLIQPIDVFVYAWLLVAALSAAYVAWDVMADKEPKPGAHEEFVKPLWKQGVGSTVHCVAGDATGIVAAAAITAAAGFPMWADLIIEYVTGFLFGLLTLPIPLYAQDDGRHVP